MYYSAWAPIAPAHPAVKPGITELGSCSLSSFFRSDPGDLSETFRGERKSLWECCAHSKKKNLSYPDPTYPDSQLTEPRKWLLY